MPKEINPPDTHYLSAAIGWLELGNPDEAEMELKSIRAEFQSHPDVLQTRWQIFAQQNRWEECLQIAAILLLAMPKSPFGWIHRSYALHEMKRTLEAYNELFPAVPRFPKEWLIRYNLACYCSRLGRLEEARDWLEKAFKLGNRAELKQMAMEDPDLEMIWSGF